jgi:type IV secretory pathway TrbL component
MASAPEGEGAATGEAIAADTGAATGAATGEAIAADTGAATGAATGEATAAATGAATGAATHEATGAPTGPAVLGGAAQIRGLPIARTPARRENDTLQDSKFRETVRTDRENSRESYEKITRKHGPANSGEIL